MCVAQGLPPLPEPSNDPVPDSAATATTAKTKPKATNSKSLNFSSTGSKPPVSAGQKKRKAVVDLQLQDEEPVSLGDHLGKDKSLKHGKKKAKKTDKKLLSFGDEA